MPLEKVFNAASKAEAQIIVDYSDKLNLILARYNVHDIETDIDIKFAALKDIENNLGISTPSAMMELSSWLLQQKGIDMNSIDSEIAIIKEDIQENEQHVMMGELAALAGDVDYSAMSQEFAAIEPNVKPVLNCSFCEEEISSFNIMCFVCGKALHVNCGLRKSGSKHAFCSQECIAKIG